MMTEITMFLSGGILLILPILWKYHELRNALVLILCHTSGVDNSGTTCSHDLRVRAWLRFGGHFLLSIVATWILIDPLVSGTALVEVHAPKAFAHKLDNLRVRAVPVGVRGPAGGTRISTAGFDQGGVALLDIEFAGFESRASIEVLDESQPRPLVASQMVYVSPCVRRQLCALVVAF